MRRGLEGTAQVAHGILADVVTGLPGDFPAPPAGHPVQVPPTITGRNSLGADVTIDTADLPKGDLTYVITKATAAAITLSAPSKAQNGLRVTFRSATAAAHTVTLAAGFYGDAGSSDIATFAAKIGASMTIEANARRVGRDCARERDDRVRTSPPERVGFPAFRPRQNLQELAAARRRPRVSLQEDAHGRAI